jgi:hypothetical protein
VDSNKNPNYVCDNVPAGRLPPADAKAFCIGYNDTYCRRAYGCIPPANRDDYFVYLFGTSIAACQAIYNQDCDDAAAICPTYVPSLASTCLTNMESESCSLLFGRGEVPPECSAACP